MVIKGNPVSPGVVFGRIYVYAKPSGAKPNHEYFEPGSETIQRAAFDAALAAALAELDNIVERMIGAGEPDKAKIFEAHKELLTDEELLENIATNIEVGRKVPEYAVDAAFTEFIELLGGVEDPIIASRAIDLRDVRDRLFRILRNEAEVNLSRLDEPVIIAAYDLLPSDTATLDKDNVLGIITETGGATSHTAIIANAYGIPAVLGIGAGGGAFGALKNGMYVGMDAIAGEIFIEPDPEQTSLLVERAKLASDIDAEARKYLAQPAVSKDGVAFDIGINVGSDEWLPAYAHCDFVGLFRTEFLYMGADRIPSEEEQYAAYRRVLENAAGKPVTLRTLDIGGDKTLDYMDLPREDNPFLGNRALRLCFDMPDLFCDQLRATLRAAVHGEMWIMLPMVSGIEDIRRAKKIYDDAKVELDKKKIARGEPKFGIMIEVPAIANIADLVAREVDFASIGTNDLCQYMCAADRMNSAVAAYYRGFSPAMIRILGDVADAFDNAGKPVSVCGEMAGDDVGAVVLAGLGYRKLSMSAGRVARIKSVLSNITVKDAQAAASAAKNAYTEAEIIEIIKQKFLIS